jgi:3-deoxy-D-manno-octulosonate 8-phosphate phosphatase KdsC-like HAD superfamily phosphatase
VARDIDPAQVVYLGNDVNDLECMPLVACGVAVADAHPDVLAAADIVLSQSGGRGAVRELCDRLAERLSASRRQADDVGMRPDGRKVLSEPMRAAHTNDKSGRYTP